ncbi:MAG TPA: hypothetical protein VI548_02650, partial [Chitinophagaceae bacterium]|nr:hypothetical protein [Chitinophagaceae bacterium]
MSKQAAVSGLMSRDLSKENFNGPASGGRAFSHSKNQRDGVINYIMTQEEHHRNKTFREEYLKMLADFEVEYEEKYLF